MYSSSKRFVCDQAWINLRSAARGLDRPKDCQVYRLGVSKLFRCVAYLWPTSLTPLFRLQVHHTQRARNIFKSYLYCFCLRQELRGNTAAASKPKPATPPAAPAVPLPAPPAASTVVSVSSGTTDGKPAKPQTARGGIGSDEEWESGGA